MTVAKLAVLLKAAEKAHHLYEQVQRSHIHDQAWVDTDWAEWYAQYIVTRAGMEDALCHQASLSDQHLALHEELSRMSDEGCPHDEGYGHAV